MEKAQEAISYLEGLIRDTDLVIPACSPELRRKLEAQREYYELAVEALRQTLKTGDPLTIDREKWKACELCHTCGNCEHNMGYECSQEMEIGKPGCEKFTPANNYCWKCGRPLTEEAWAELEKRIGHRMKGGQTMEVKKFKVILRGQDDAYADVVIDQDQANFLEALAGAFEPCGPCAPWMKIVED